MIAARSIVPVLVVVLFAAGCGDSGGGPAGTASTPTATLPAARRYVAVGTTNSYIGPQRTVIAVRGTSVSGDARGQDVFYEPAATVAHLFGLVAGSSEAPKPATPTNCADCGTAYAQADGRYFRPSAAFREEFDRVKAQG
ncbi:MAG: hypothetical protein QOG68_2666 [Solirubrobacteraceae bacterium]|nr:hypothetical protein [Solirubrobacteraceae bacterium]